jgi:hypothetical protein
MRLGFDARDRCRRHEFAVGLQDEQIARPVEDDASARPAFVFVGLHNCTQGGLDSPVTAPVIPGFVVARDVGQTIAARPNSKNPNKWRAARATINKLIPQALQSEQPRRRKAHQRASTGSVLETPIAQGMLVKPNLKALGPTSIKHVSQPSTIH